MNKQILVFSGLGADQRVFRHIDWGTNEVIHVPWIEPQNNEGIEAYAGRLIANLPIRNPVLVGLSFGGIIAIEVSRLVQYERIILLSSVKRTREIPWYIRLAGAIHLHRLVPDRILKGAGTIQYWLFGLTTREGKNLLDGFLEQSSINYLRWAIGRMLTWKNSTIPPSVLHIHGETDRIFPLRFVQANVVIKDGGHFMVFDHADEVNYILRELL